MTVVDELHHLRGLERRHRNDPRREPAKEGRRRVAARAVEPAHDLGQLLELAQRLPLDRPLRAEGEPRPAPARDELRQHHGTARADGHRGSHDDERVGVERGGNGARGVTEGLQHGLARHRIHGRRDAEHGSIDGLPRQLRDDAQPFLEERGELLGDAGLVEVGPAGLECADDPWLTVVPEDRHALLREGHGEREPDVAETDDRDPDQSRSPSATSRLAFSRSGWRPTSSQYSRIAYAATCSPRARRSRISSGASKYCPRGSMSTTEGSST